MVHGGVRLEQLPWVEKSLPWELRALRDPVDALLCFIPKLSGIPGAQERSLGAQCSGGNVFLFYLMNCHKTKR